MTPATSAAAFSREAWEPAPAPPTVRVTGCAACGRPDGSCSSVAPSFRGLRCDRRRVLGVYGAANVEAIRAGTAKDAGEAALRHAIDTHRRVMPIWTALSPPPLSSETIER